MKKNQIFISLFIICITSQLFSQVPDFDIIPYATLDGHTENVYSLAYHPNGKILASASADKTIIIWDLNSKKAIRTLSGHSDRIRTIDFSPDGTLLASCSIQQKDKNWVGEIKIWNVEDGRDLLTFTAESYFVRSIDFYPDGNMIVISGGSPLFYGFPFMQVPSYPIGIFDVSNGKLIQKLKEQKSSINSAIFNTNGDLLAFGEADGTLNLWSIIRSGEKLKIKKFKETTFKSSTIRCVAFHPNGKVIACGCSLLKENYTITGGEINVLDLSSGKVVKTLTGYSEAIHSLIFNPDGTLLASGSATGKNGIVKIWDLTRDLEIKTLKMDGKGIVESLIFSSDGKILASTNDKEILLWQIDYQ